MGFLDALKRRKVFKVGVAYLVVAWLLVQAASIGFPAFEAPPWALRIFILVVLLGFPVSLLFAWAFDVTPEGVRVEGPTHGSKRLLGIVVALVVLAFVWYFKGQPTYHGDGPIAPASPVATQTAPASNISRKSIAVLPFADLSPAKDQEYLSDGIAEEILNALAQAPDLKVAGRTSSFHFKGKDDDLRAIGLALGVAHILEGSVRKQGEKVRITTQLVQTDDGFHLWSKTYDGDMGDVFALQERIARDITASLKVILVADAAARLAPTTTQDPQAYQQYLRGRYFWYRRGYDNLQAAAEALEAAVARDPGYVDAWSALAQTYVLLPEYSFHDPSTDRRLDEYDKGLAAAERALQLDPRAPRALLARAYARHVGRFDWAGAQADFEATIASNPRDATAHQWYGQFFATQGRWPEAVAKLDRAIELDPLSPIIVYNRGLVQDAQGDFTGALPYLDQAITLSGGLNIYAMSAFVDRTTLGRREQALAAVRELPEERRAVLASLVDALEDRTRTEIAVAQLDAHPLAALDQPWAFVTLGRNDLALDALERMFAAKDPNRVYVLQTHAFRVLYPDPRFRALVRELGLPESTLDRLAAQRQPP